MGWQKYAMETVKCWKIRLLQFHSAGYSCFTTAALNNSYGKEEETPLPLSPAHLGAPVLLLGAWSVCKALSHPHLTDGETAVAWTGICWAFTMLTTSDIKNNRGRLAFCFFNCLVSFSSHYGTVRLPRVLSITPDSPDSPWSLIISQTSQVLSNHGPSWLVPVDHVSWRKDG